MKLIFSLVEKQYPKPGHSFASKDMITFNISDYAITFTKENAISPPIKSTFAIPH